MQLLTFSPAPHPGLKRVREYPETRVDSPLREAAVAFEAALAGTTSGVCYQTAGWMGRGCFVEVPGGHYLAIKGTGPSPGSEAMRALLDGILRRQADGRGGCLRLHTSSYYPILVPFRDSDGTWEILDTRPEGFSSFALLYRDAASAIFYRQLGVRALAPLMLLRHNVPTPWCVQSSAGIRDYLSERLPRAIADHLSIGRTKSQTRLHFTRLSYLDMDAGILIRMARSPFRIANLHHAAIGNDRETLEWLAGHMLETFDVEPALPSATETVSIQFTEQLAQTAAQLFCEGVIHGQLNTHYQNVSLAAELADFDKTIFVRSLPDCATGIPFAGDRAELPYQSFWSQLHRQELELNFRTLPVISADFEELTGLDSAGFNIAEVAASMLRQMYDLYVQAVRTADLLQRRHTPDLRQPGSVLSADQRGELRRAFSRTFNNEIARQRSRTLYDWSVHHGYDCLMRRLLDRRGTRTIYGWTSANVPINHSDVLCDSTRLAHIRADVTSFFKALSS